ncbi:MAG TPA: portal protein, partial [Ferruginibacter sp.]|nr:portal protein [Ferruginibacter sp.]
METIAEEMSVEDIDSINEALSQRLYDAGIDEAEVLKKAREDLVLWEGYFGENVTRGKDDMNFVLRDQWSAVERSEFTRLFKPAMTFNKLYDVTKKVIGEQRKNKPDLLVRSLTGKSTQKQIDLRADLVRTISYQSQNDLVYQTAFRSALMMGYGAFEISLEYENPTSFNQVVRYEIIPDSTRTAFDPAALKPHKGDGNFCSRQYVYTK